MKRFMLNNLKSGLVVLGLFLMVGVAALTFGFKNATKANVAEKSAKIFTPQWYELSSTGALPTNQIIGMQIGSKPNAPGCNEINLGNSCAVQINFSDEVPDFEDIEGKSLAFILANYPSSSVADATRLP